MHLGLIKHGGLRLELCSYSIIYSQTHFWSLIYIAHLHFHAQWKPCVEKLFRYKRSGSSSAKKQPDVCNYRLVATRVPSGSKLDKACARGFWLI